MSNLSSPPSASPAGRVLYFGKLRDVAGASEEALPATGIGQPVSALVALLAQERPEMGAALAAPSVRVCINQRLIAPSEDPTIGAQDEIAFLPPMSGG